MCDCYQDSENDLVCTNCGICTNDVNYGEPSFNQEIAIKRGSKKEPRLVKWLEYTKEEKKIYKQSIYIRQVCDNFDLDTFTIESSVSVVTKVLQILKNQNEGKRSKLKDAIVTNCIYYINKQVGKNYQSYLDLGKKINLDTKSLTKANKLLLSIAEKVPELKMTSIETPMDVISCVTHNENVCFPEEILKTTEKLVFVLEKFDIICDHTPLSIASACLFYVLEKYKLDVQPKDFCNVFGISVVTMNKTISKMKKGLSKYDLV